MTFRAVQSVRIVQPIWPCNAILHDNEMGARQWIWPQKTSRRIAPEWTPVGTDVPAPTLVPSFMEKSLGHGGGYASEGRSPGQRRAALPGEYRYWPV